MLVPVLIAFGGIGGGGGGGGRGGGGGVKFTAIVVEGLPSS